MMNEYGGSWWDLPVAQIGTYMDSIHHSYPDKPFLFQSLVYVSQILKVVMKEELKTWSIIWLFTKVNLMWKAIYFDLTDYRTHFRNI